MIGRKKVWCDPNPLAGWLCRATILSIRSSPVRSETSNPWSDPPPATQAYACPASRYSHAALPLVPSPPSPRDAAAAQPTSRSAPPPSRRPTIPTPSRHPPPRAATAVPSRHPLPAIPPNLRGAKIWRHERTASGSRQPTGSAAAVGGQGPRGSWCPALPEQWPRPPVPVRACPEGLQVNATGAKRLPGRWPQARDFIDFNLVIQI